MDRAQLIEAVNPHCTFDTPFERGCVVCASANIDGEFTAWDSDGVMCSYSVEMITQLRAPRPIDGVASVIFER